MPNISITDNGIGKMIKGLKTHKAAGPDQISPRILKELSSSVTPILGIIFRKSYDSGEIPDQWRKANVVPIYKKGKKSDPANYRPISLTSIVCKLMEHIITSSIMRHGNQKHGVMGHILYDLQHGFRAQRSCETQLIEFCTDIVNNLQDGKQTDVIVLDFSKAFDKVSHKMLLEKLHHYGIRGKTNKWIADFLTNRTQNVVLDGESSYTGKVISGEPQGSVLGPSLFLYYINDLPEGLGSKVRLFADDTVIYMAIKWETDAKDLQSDLDKLVAWESKWKMKFNPKKCEVLHITRSRNPQKFTYKLHGVDLASVKSTKYLGVNISSDLRWNTHIDSITAKATRSLNFIKRNLQISNPKLKTVAYNSLVRPLVEYASPVWDPHTATNIAKLEMVQRRAARYVLHRYHYRSSVGLMLDQLGWHSLQQRREQARLSMLYKIHKGDVAIDKHSYLVPEIHRGRKSEHNESYQVPHSRVDYHRYSFFPNTVRVWNCLPVTVVTAVEFPVFKARLAATYATGSNTN